MLSAVLINCLKVSVLQQSRVPGEALRQLFGSFIHGWAGKQNGPCTGTTPGSPASRKRACVLWRGDGTTQPFRSLFSFACENRAPWNGDAGWVEKCAWALTCGTPTQDCLRWANDKYKGTQAFRATLWHRDEEKLPNASGLFGSWLP